MQDVLKEIDKLSELLMDNYLLSAVVIVVTEKVEEGTIMKASRKGNSYEHIGMLEDYKHKLIYEDSE